MSVLLLDDRSQAPLPTFPVPPMGLDLTTWGRRKGASWASSLLARPVDFRAWAKILGRAFNHRFHTQVNVTSARWPSLDPVAVWPFLKTASGKFDLYAKNPEFWNDRLPRYIDVMNREGGIVQLCLMDLYQFSDRKGGTPDKNLSPVRYNVNGIYWPGDDTFLAQQLPDDWWRWLARELATTLRGAAVAYVPFNEGPEKDIHITIAQEIKRVDLSATIIANRNEDTPGQYWNMKVGRGTIDMLAYHGWASTADLSQTFHEVDELPNTFDMMLAKENQNGESINVDWARIISSSDGARRSSAQGGNDLIDPTKSWREWRTYNWDALLKVWKRVILAGGNIEHQSVLKMDRTDDVKFDLATAEVGFLEEMARL